MFCQADEFHKRERRQIGAEPGVGPEVASRSPPWCGRPAIQCLGLPRSLSTEERVGDILPSLNPPPG